MKLSFQDQDDVEREVERTAFDAAAHSIVDTQSAITVLAITVPTELMAFVMIYVAKDEVFKFFESGNNAWLFAAVGAYVVGFMTTLAVYRLMPLRFRRTILSTTVWPVAIVTGIANIALFVVLLYGFR